MELGAVIMGIFTILILKVSVIVLTIRTIMALGRILRTMGRPPLALPPQGEEGGLVLLWWSMVLFLVSECMCSLEILVRNNVAIPCSCAHGLLSALGTGIFAVGLLRVVDDRFLHFGERRCLLISSCRSCTFLSRGLCRYRKVLWGLLLGTVLLVVLPLFMSVETMVAEPPRWSLPWESLNQWYDRTVVPYLVAHVEHYDPGGHTYKMPSLVLAAEFHWIPILASLPLVGAFLSLGTGREPRALEPLTCALGILSYTYMELVLYRATGDIILGALGHELAELWFLLVFRALLSSLLGPVWKGPARREGTE